MLRAALESHFEGLRISERTEAIMPIVRQRRKKIGGQAHSVGSKANKASAQQEAMSIKKEAVQYMRKEKEWSAV